MRRPVKFLAIFFGALVAIVVVWATFMYAIHIRYNGPVEQGSFQSGNGVTIKGWFVKPDNAGRYPAVVILHGSGRGTGGHPAMRTITNAFLRSGISVLAYDKRGVGLSGGTFYHYAYGDFIEDGKNAVRYLKSRDDVDPDAIGLLGSSEGGWFTPEIAVTTDSVAFVVNRAGPPLPWIDTNLWEIRHDLIDSGVSGELLAEAIRLQGLVWRFLVKVNANPALDDSEERRHIDSELSSFEQTRGQTDIWLKQGRRFGKKLADYESYYKSRAMAIGYDPQPYIEQLRIPMLYIFAENDENVPTVPAVEYLRSLQAQPGKDIEVIVIAGVGHSMLSPAALIAGGSDPAFLNAIGPWAAAKISAELPTP